MDVARDTNKGHTVKAVTETFQLAKDSGFKVVSHMMPESLIMTISADSWN